MIRVQLAINVYRALNSNHYIYYCTVLVFEFILIYLDFDDEGVPSTTTTILKGKVYKNYVMDQQTPFYQSQSQSHLMRPYEFTIIFIGMVHVMMVRRTLSLVGYLSNYIREDNSKPTLSLYCLWGWPRVRPLEVILTNQPGNSSKLAYRSQKFSQKI